MKHFIVTGHYYRQMLNTVKIHVPSLTLKCPIVLKLEKKKKHFIRHLLKLKQDRTGSQKIRRYATATAKGELDGLAGTTDDSIRPN